VVRVHLYRDGTLSRLLMIDKKIFRFEESVIISACVVPDYQC
jgi:hypothetical protein